MWPEAVAACPPLPMGPPKLPRHASTPQNKILRFWAEIIYTFSQCQLTREEIKLVALSGIAKAVQKHLSNNQYLAGLWRQELDENLLWLIGDLQFISREPQDARSNIEHLHGPVPALMAR